MLAFLSLCFFALILVEYAFAANITGIISSYPIWLWGIILGSPAILAWVCFSSKLGLLACFLWVACIITLNDNLPVVARLGKNQTSLTTYEKLKSCKAITLNCHSLPSLDAATLAPYSPDIVLLQGLTDHHDITAFAKELFGEEAKITTSDDCATIAKGGEIMTNSNIPGVNGHIIEWQPPGSPAALRIVNINLEYVDPFRSLFSPTNWLYYADKRAIHRQQILNIIHSIRLLESTTRYELPLILGGSFSVQSTSPIFKTLDEIYRDGYQIVGSTYGATFPSSLPIMRMDRFYISSVMGCKLHHTINIPKSTRKAVCIEVYPKVY